MNYMFAAALSQSDLWFVDWFFIVDVSLFFGFCGVFAGQRSTLRSELSLSLAFGFVVC